MQSLAEAGLLGEAIIELPDRDLLGGLIHISGINIDIDLLQNLLNGSFNHWTINVLNGNDVDVTVADNVSQNDLDVFCNQVVAVLSAQCNASLTQPPDP